MIFAVLGGDGRSAHLCRLLAQEGHEVRAFALEGAGELAGAYAVPGARECVTGADCVVLPMPVCTAQGALFAPQSSAVHGLGEILDAVPCESLLLGGRVDKEAQAMAAQRGVHIHDYFAREALTVGNAAVTAECALEILMRETPATLWRSKVLVIGFGRIGKLLAQRLHGLGAHVTVSARKDEDKAWIDALGYACADTRALGGALGEYDIIVNTVPAPVLTETLLREVRADALLLDLASSPGGTDFAAAEKLGLRVIWALGLPGEAAPQRAAELIKESIFNILEERYGTA